MSDVNTFQRREKNETPRGRNGAILYNKKSVLSQAHYQIAPHFCVS
jgi:hypothetical protein